MGVLLYGSPGTSIDFDDRALMHLQIVITGKLRRGESFLATWVNSPAQGSGRSSIWLEPSIPLFYRFTGSRVPRVNADWLKVLSVSANSGTGLIFTSEPPSGGSDPLSHPRPLAEITANDHA